MPGDMGHGIAKVLVENNFKVLTFLKGRSKRTLKLANEARVINIDNFVNINLITTPHIGASTNEAQLKAGLETVENIKKILAGDSSVEI